MDALKGKTALIIGAASGIGAETARLLASRGAAVAVADVNIDGARHVVEEIETAGGSALAVQLDMAVEAEVEAAVARTLERFGRIDVLHNNAAITARDFLNRDVDVATMDVELWDRTMAVNLRGPMLATKHVVPHMIRQGGGSIINTSSGKGIQGDLVETAYGVSKGGLVTLTQYTATQYGKLGIRANVLIVGLVASEAQRASFAPEAVSLFESHHLTPSIGTPRDIANIVAFLASDDSRFVTGHMIGADGGFTVHNPAVAQIRAMLQDK